MVRGFGGLCPRTGARFGAKNKRAARPRSSSRRVSSSSATVILRFVFQWSILHLQNSSKDAGIVIGTKAFVKMVPANDFLPSPWNYTSGDESPLTTAQTVGRTWTLYTTFLEGQERSS